jgi:hypothetical protein
MMLSSALTSTRPLSSSEVIATTTITTTTTTTRSSSSSTSSSSSSGNRPAGAGEADRLRDHGQGIEERDDRSSPLALGEGSTPSPIRGVPGAAPSAIAMAINTTTANISNNKNSNGSSSSERFEEDASLECYIARLVTLAESLVELEDLPAFQRMPEIASLRNLASSARSRTGIFDRRLLPLSSLPVLSPASASSSFAFSHTSNAATDDQQPQQQQLDLRPLHDARQTLDELLKEHQQRADAGCADRDGVDVAAIMARQAEERKREREEELQRLSVEVSQFTHSPISEEAARCQHRCNHDVTLATAWRGVCFLGTPVGGVGSDSLEWCC